jgi:hypothetical protein
MPNRSNVNDMESLRILTEKHANDSTSTLQRCANNNPVGWTIASTTLSLVAVVLSSALLVKMDMVLYTTDTRHTPKADVYGYGVCAENRLSSSEMWMWRREKLRTSLEYLHSVPKTYIGATVFTVERGGHAVYSATLESIDNTTHVIALGLTTPMPHHECSFVITAS